MNTNLICSYNDLLTDKQADEAINSIAGQTEAELVLEAPNSDEYEQVVSFRTNPDGTILLKVNGNCNDSYRMTLVRAKQHYAVYLSKGYKVQADLLT